MSQPMPVDVESLVAIEGNPQWYFHLKRERDHDIAVAKRHAARQRDGRLLCEACGFDPQIVYPALHGDICEIHHRKPLSEAVSSVATTLDDLAVLCPTCHRAIHRTTPLMSVEQFRHAFFSASADR